MFHSRTVPADPARDPWLRSCWRRAAGGSRTVAGHGSQRGRRDAAVSRYCRCQSSKTSSCHSRSVWSRLPDEVLAHEPVDERRLEIAALARARRPQHVGEHVASGRRGTSAERHAESLLLPIEDRRRAAAPRATSFSTCLRRPFVNLQRAGSVAANSMTSLSSSGTRDSIECAMLMRSTFVSTSSGR